MSRPDDSASPKEPLIRHLGELRMVLVVSVIAIFVGFVVVFLGFSERLLLFISEPLLARDIQIVNIGVAETFVAQLKASFVAGIVLASPVVFWKIWSFLRPALFPQERVMFRLLFFVILSLFISGIMFAYLLVFNITINFFLMTSENIATPMISLDMYISMLFSFVVPFGLVFQFPVVIFALHKLGLVTIQGLARQRKYIVFAVFALATLLTPPDIVSQVLLALPMIVLYEVSIIVLRIISVRKPRAAALEND